MLLMQQLSHALVAAATTADEHDSPYGAPMGLGIILVAVGALAYSGKWRSWSTSRALIIYKVAPVALGWAGIGAIVAAVASMLPEPLAEIVGIPAIAFFLMCLFGMVRLPRFMLPRWYRIQKGLEPAAPVSIRRGTRSARVSLVPSSAEGLGPVPPVGSAADVAFASRIGAAVGGVDATAPTCPYSVDESSSPERSVEPCRPDGPRLP
jgi:hypothetical protein